jgi:hypothetical protein
MKLTLIWALLASFLCGIGVNAQTTPIDPIPSLSVQPIPIPGGDVAPGYGLINQFFPGPAGVVGYDPPNAEPGGITNFHGVAAMGYTSGTATDNHGNVYTVGTDIRVYQGEYVGGHSTDPNSAGYTTSARARGTFVEI